MAEKNKVVEGIVTFMLYTTVWAEEDASEDRIKQILAQEAHKDLCSAEPGKVKPYKVELTQTTAPAS